MRAVCRAPLAVSLVIAAALGAACDKKEAAQTPAASASAAESAKPLASAPAASASAAAGERMRGFHGGLAGMFFRGAHDLALKDEQKAKLDQLAADLRPNAGDGGTSRDEMKARHAELAVEIRAGKIDAAKLDAMLGAVEKTAQAQKDKEAAALDGLHAALEPAQRKALVEKLRARREHRERGGVDGGALRDDHAKRRAAAMTRELDLDDAQQKKLEAILAKGAPNPPDMKKQTDTAIDAFEKDAFDAKKLPGFADAGKTARAFAAHEVQLFAQLVPVLKPDQREKLAARVEAGPPMRAGRPGRAGGLAPPLFDDVVDD